MIESPATQGIHPGVWVTQAFPAPLQAALAQHGGIPQPVRATVLEQLNHRSPAALRERIERRFYLRYANVTGPELMERADEIALTLVVPGDCEDPRCEDGWLLDEMDSAGGCPQCRRRRIETAAMPPSGPPASAERLHEVADQVRARIREARSTARHLRRPSGEGRSDV